MGNITLMLPEELQEKMKEHSEIRWSEVIRKAIQKKIEDLSFEIKSKGEYILKVGKRKFKKVIFS